MNIESKDLEPWSTTIDGRPVTKIIFSQGMIVIELASDELLENVKKWRNGEYDS